MLFNQLFGEVSMLDIGFITLVIKICKFDKGCENWFYSCHETTNTINILSLIMKALPCIDIEILICLGHLCLDEQIQSKYDHFQSKDYYPFFHNLNKNCQCIEICLL